MRRRSSRTSVVVGALVVVALVTTQGPAFASTDFYTSRQWALRTVGGEKAWQTGRGSGMTIAILDTGVDLAHEDLKGALVAGRDIVDNDSNPSDANGHGTHVAGIVAARANNGVGVAGVAPAAKIMPVRVLDETGSGLEADIDAGVRWAVDHGADVVNLSIESGVTFGGINTGSLSGALDYAWSKGVVPVISAGNDAEVLRTELQGARTMVVTATARDNSAPSYATGVGLAAWGIAAPGGSEENGQEAMVFSTFWTANSSSRYGWAVGTSVSAPHVAGAAAILRGLGLTPQQTVDRLLATATDIGDAGDDVQFGHGLLNVSAAVAGLGKTAGGNPAPPSNPTPQTPSNPTPQPAAQTPSGQAGLRPKRIHREIAGQATSPPDPDSTGDPDERTLASGDEQDDSGTPGFVLVIVLGIVAIAPVAYGSYWLMRHRRGL